MIKTNNGPNRHRRNYGYGRSCKFAARNICRAIFGSEKYATRKSHESRIKRFLKHELITDLRDISQDQLTSYYEVVAAQVADEEISQQYACNLISSLNIMLHYLSQHRYKFRQPSEILGRRNRKRKRAVNIGVDEIENLAERLRLDSEEDIALCLMLCRHCGLRLREALMLDFDEAIASYRKHALINVIRGCKGGRKADRFIRPPGFVIEEIERFRDQTGWACLIPPNRNFVQRKSEIHRKLLPLLKGIGFKTIHDLRAAFACERFIELAGNEPPIMGGPAFNPEDREKYLVLSRELGHGRIDVLHSYTA